MAEWQAVTDLEVGTKRYADGDWRIVDDEMETRLEVRSNGMTGTFTITPATHPDSYQTLAELAIKALNSVTRRE